MRRDVQEIFRMTPHHKQVRPPSLRPFVRLRAREGSPWPYLRIQELTPLALAFRARPPARPQVMMFSATLNKEVRLTCKKFMQNVGPPFACAVAALPLMPGLTPPPPAPLPPAAARDLRR